MLRSFHRRVFVDTLGFIGPMIGMANLNDVMRDRLRVCPLDMVQWGGPYPYHRSWDAFCAEIEQTVALFQPFNRLRIVRSNCDMQIFNGLQVLLGSQSTDLVGDHWERLDYLWNQGIRVLQIAYQGMSPYGAGFKVKDDPGLTPLGRRMLEEMYSRGFILDLSHTGERTGLEAAREYMGPVFISHTGARAVYDHPRNATDELMQMVRARGGTVGICAVPFFLHPTDNSVDPLIDHLVHTAKLIGADHVTLGLDGPITGHVDLSAAKESFDRMMQGDFDADGIMRARWPTFVQDLETNSPLETLLGLIHPARLDEDDVAWIAGESAWEFYLRSLPLV